MPEVADGVFDGVFGEVPECCESDSGCCKARCGFDMRLLVGVGLDLRINARD